MVFINVFINDVLPLLFSPISNKLIADDSSTSLTFPLG